MKSHPSTLISTQLAFVIILQYTTLSAPFSWLCSFELTLYLCGFVFFLPDRSFFSLSIYVSSRHLCSCITAMPPLKAPLMTFYACVRILFYWYIPFQHPFLILMEHYSLHPLLLLCNHFMNQFQRLNFSSFLYLANCSISTSPSASRVHSLIIFILYSTNQHIFYFSIKHIGVCM